MVKFVGAGPGDPDLITVKGQKALMEADCVIYAGSLVSSEHLKVCKKECLIYDSASMTLEEVLAVMETQEKEKKKTVRLHTGDPSLFGAIREQMDGLREKGIDFEIIPGVSSFLGAASVLQEELTLPGVSQTVILTRNPGRTGTGEGGTLEELSKHQASMAIFLSVQNMKEVVDKLLVNYNEDTPVAVVYKATWPDQKIVRGTLKTIEGQVKEAGITRFAQILVGDFMKNSYEKSLLYHKEFTHMYRQGIKEEGV